MPSIKEGVVVRHKTWAGKPTGTIVRVTSQSVFVQWHDSPVEDQISRADFDSTCDLTDLPNPPGNGLRLGVIRPYDP